MTRPQPAYRARTWVSPVPITCHVIGCLWRDGTCVYCGDPEAQDVPADVRG